MRKAERFALIEATRAGGVQSTDRAGFYPDRWFTDPLFVVTSTHVKIHQRITQEPIWQDDAAFSQLVRMLVEESKAKSRGTRGYVSDAVWLPILAAFGNRCAYCGASDVPLEKDHRVPVSKSGSNDPDNLVPACKPCNVRKGASDPDGWPMLRAPVS